MARDIVDDRLIGALHLRALTRNGFVHDPAQEHVAFQVGTLDALMGGAYDGDATIGDVLAHGDLGLGTVQHLGGELVIVDGTAFVVDGDGRVRAVANDTRTPCAVTCRFTPHARHEITTTTPLAALHELLDRLADGAADIVAVRVDGTFRDLRLRSVRSQRRPYPPLAAVTRDQTEWTVAESTGTLVGFRFPASISGVEVPGYHLHYVDDDRAVGGHVLDAVAERGIAAVDTGDELHVELPRHVQLGVPGAADRAAIREVEGG